MIKDQNDLKKALLKDSRRNISALGFFENFPFEKVFEKNGSLIALGRSDHLWAYLASSSADELSGLLQEFNFETSYFASLESWMVPIVTRFGDVEWELKTNRYFLPDTAPNSPSLFDLSSLNESHARYIFDHSDYREYTSIGYIVDRLRQDISAAVFTAGRPAAWGLTHDDGTLGFLHVLPQYRRSGYGTAVLQGLIRKKRDAGRPVYANIEPVNSKAINLVTSLGFIFDREISWLKLGSQA